MLEGDGSVSVADKFLPAQGKSGLHGYPGLDGGREHRFAVGGVLGVEPLHARHGNDAGGNALGLQGFTGLHRELDLRSGADQDDLRLGGAAVG